MRVRYLIKFYRIYYLYVETIGIAAHPFGGGDAHIDWVTYMTIRTKLIGAFALILVFLGVNSAFLFVHVQSTSTSFDEITQSSSQITDQVLPLITVTQDLKVNVLQVQQWLTDISATRGLDGLNDGFDEAQANAQEFRRNLETAIRLTQALNKPEMTSALEAMGQAFDPYYETGKKMAEAYIAEGPAGGNKMMGGFDEVAARIQSGMDKVALQVKQFVADRLMDGEALLSDKKEQNLLLEKLALVPVVISVLVGLLVIFAILRICRNISDMTGVMSDLSQGNLDVNVPATERKDELGHMAGAVLIFKEGAIENKNLHEEKIRLDEQTRHQRHETMMKMADELESRVVGSMKEIAAILIQLEEMSSQMSQAADTTSTKSQAVCAASEQTTANMEAVSASGSELSASIDEISRQVSQSSELSKAAVVEAQGTNGRIEALASEVSRIDDIVKLITDIAEQTNLLALNATIEAARAGEAGKGFAVVASEVKNLAQQTAKATEQISGQISKIHSETAGAVGAIDEIAHTISRLDDFGASIAAAVDQQNSATREISMNVHEAARGNEEVSENISGVAAAAEDTDQLAHKVSDSANSLKEASQKLRSSVQGFLDDIRDGESGNIRF